MGLHINTNRTKFMIIIHVPDHFRNARLTFNDNFIEN